MKHFAFLLISLALLGCATDPDRLAVSLDTSSARVQTRAKSVEIKEVSLPTYAKEEQVTVQAENGMIVSLENTAWADDPERALTNALVRNLSAITKAQIAAAPWPLNSLPDAELTVRIEQMLVQTDNTLSVVGQYAVNSETRAGRIRPLSISVPVGALDQASVAKAHSEAWKRLAEKIAADL